MSNKELKSANSAKIGITFSNARSKIGLTPIEVSEKTLINLKYIQAIESGDYSNFPSEAFARAYFIKYAKFLSIKCDFPSIYEANTREEEIVEKSIPKINKSFYNLFSAVSLLLIVLIVILIKFLSNKNIDSIDIKNTQVNLSEENISLIVGSVKSNIISSQNKILEPAQSTIKAMSNEISLLFNDQCWIEIYSNDELVEYQLFNAGDSFEKVINRPFKIIIGNAEAVSGTYDGDFIDFISNANRLRVNTIIFNDE